MCLVERLGDEGFDGFEGDEYFRGDEGGVRADGLSDLGDVAERKSWACSGRGEAIV